MRFEAVLSRVLFTTRIEGRHAVAGRSPNRVAQEERSARSAVGLAVLWFTRASISTTWSGPITPESDDDVEHVDILMGTKVTKTITEVLAEVSSKPPEEVRAHVLAHYIQLLKQQPRDAINVEMDITFGPHERHRLDLHTPKGKSPKPLPVVMFFYGGGFTRGHKNLHGEWIYGNVPNFFVRNGFIGINAGYRLADQAQWPGGAEDVGRAVAWVRQNIAAYGGDPEFIFIMGHSSGATHVATYALRPELHPADGPGIAGVIIMSGGFYLTPEDPEPNHLAYYGPVEEWGDRALIPHAQWGDFEVFLSTAELEPYSFNRSFTEMVAALTARSGKMPKLAMFRTHNQYSEQMAIGTGDEQIEATLLDFVRGAVAKLTI
jgi:acetyl esterase